MSEENSKHEHDHGKEHNHVHSEEHTRQAINRINRIIGHAKSVKTMIEDDRDCSDVLIQISAVSSALNNLGKFILKDHINTCIVDAIESNDKKTIDNLNNAIDKILK